MKQSILPLAAFSASLLTASPAPAQEVQYWGVWQGTDRGLIRFQDRYDTLGKGDEIPGLGTVEDVTPEVLVLRRALTAAERDGLAGQGRVVPDVQTRRIPNLASRGGPPLTPDAPAPSR